MNLETLMKHASFIRKELFNLTTCISRNDPPNPYWGRTIEGLVLIQYYGCPGSIGTPIGKWSVDGGGCDFCNGVWFEKSHLRFGLKEIFHLVVNRNGEFGPVYAITKGMNGEELPTPKIDLVLNDMGFFPSSKTDYDELMEQWYKIKTSLGDWKTVENRN